MELTGFLDCFQQLDEPGVLLGFVEVPGSALLKEVVLCSLLLQLKSASYATLKNNVFFKYVDKMWSLFPLFLQFKLSKSTLKIN